MSGTANPRHFHAGLKRSSYSEMISVPFIYGFPLFRRTVLLGVSKTHF